jgi:arylsulfatase
MGGALAAPSTAYIYDWNLLPIGQQMALKFLESYEKFPPLHAPPSFNLDQVMAQIRAQKQKIQTAGHPSD